MKMRFSLVEYSVDHPYRIVAIVAVLTAIALTQFPKARTDTNPKNMLPADSAVRVWNDKVDQTFHLYADTIVVGVENKAGIFNTGTLTRLKTLEDAIQGIQGVARDDVSGFTTTDNITADDSGTVQIAPAMDAVPATPAAVEALKARIFSNPLLVNRLVSQDGTVAAIYVPLEKDANGKQVADGIRAQIAKLHGPETYYVAGDPVARDTFGAEMFLLMAIFAPIAALVMFTVRFLMFGDLFLSIALMMDAMIAIVWSLGLLIGLGYPIHIMSSMAPVFLMAIATDSIHIFNEFYFRYKEHRNKRQAIIETMQAVRRPVQYTALATAAGFAVLMFMNIIPVKVFGGLVAFGTIALRFLSFSFIPAMFALVKEKNLEQSTHGEESDQGWSARWLRGLARFGGRRAGWVVLAGAVLLGVAGYGLSKITVNNNLVHWFKSGSDIRVADRVMNKALGGTSLAYIVASVPAEDGLKDPAAMRAIEGLEEKLRQLPVVGKVTSVADYVKRVNVVMRGPTFDRLPDRRNQIAQFIETVGDAPKKSDLNNVMDADGGYRQANIWVQLKSWDAVAMRAVEKTVAEYQPAADLHLTFKPAGIAHFNLVWNDEVLWDMVHGFVASLVIVFVILALNFRSVSWALVGYLPLLFTVALIYGAIGFLGVDFDMPVSVLSCLSLGMAVDFAIHFISRFRQRVAELTHPPVSQTARIRADTEVESAAVPTEELAAVRSRGLDQAELLEVLQWTAARPGKGIVRNAILFAASFSVMLFATLTPYITVGAFIVSMMTLSALMTLVGLPALIVIFRRFLLARAATGGPSSSSADVPAAATAV
ncbi:MAG: efflux RND transporter permease subunit [Planctomycetota bacterium]